MPKVTRTLIRSLPYQRRSGLFRTQDGRYEADIKPDSGGRIQRAYGRDRARAESQFEFLQEELSERELNRRNPTVLDFLTHTFLPSQTHLKSYSFTQERVAAIARYVTATAPSLRLHEVTRLHADQMREYYADRTARTQQANLQKLKQAMDYGVDVGALTANPVARCKPPRVSNRRERTCTMEEFTTLTTTRLPRVHLRDVLLVIGLAGLRPGNALGLHRDEVDFERARITIAGEKMKNHRRAVLPMSSAVADVLRQIPAQPWHFPSPRRPGMHQTDIYAAWNTLTGATGLAWLRPHDLRHFFASQLAKQGATEQQIGRLLCHVGQSVTSRYVHHDIDDLRPFVEELGERATALSG
jgi:integrase